MINFYSPTISALVGKNLSNKRGVGAHKNACAILLQKLFKFGEINKIYLYYLCLISIYVYVNLFVALSHMYAITLNYGDPPF